MATHMLNPAGAATLPLGWGTARAEAEATRATMGRTVANMSVIDVGREGDEVN